MKLFKLLSPLSGIGLVIVIWALINLMVNYESLAYAEGWGVLAMYSMIFYGLALMGVSFIVRLIFRKRTRNLIIEIVLALAGLILLGIQ